jgi:hypothetical protein
MIKKRKKMRNMRKKRKNDKYEKKRKNEKYEKKKINICPPLMCIRNFKASRLKDPYSLSNHVQSNNEDFLCASGSLFAICTCPPISSVCIFLFPLLDIHYFPMNFLTSLGKIMRSLSCSDNTSFIKSW